MSLSSDLVSQFAKITNDGKEQKAEEVTLYGKIVESESGELCVRFDGSNETTPAVTTSTIKAGDRVSAIIKNHTAIITGNFSDIAASSAELKNIKETAEGIFLSFKDTLVKIDEMGVTISGLSDGTTKIHGDCIETGTLKLTKSITFGDLADDVMAEFSSLESGISGAYTAAGDATYAAKLARDQITSWSFNGNSTYIDGNKIMTGTIRVNSLYGNNVYFCDPAGRVAADIAVTGASSTEQQKAVLSSGAFEVATYGGSIYMRSNLGPLLLLGRKNPDEPVYCQLSGAPLVIGIESYGPLSSRPARGTYGQVYFALE